MKKVLSALPGMLTVILVAVSAAFLVTHPPRPTAQSGSPNVAPTAPTAAKPAPPAPATAAPVSGPNPSTSAPPPAASSSSPPPATQPSSPAGAPEPSPSTPAPSGAAPAPVTPPAAPGASEPAPTTSTPPAAPSRPAPAASAPSTPPAALRAPGGQHGFRVQAGVFRNRVYAEDLVRQLRDKGYNATLAEGSLLRVLVGPATIRADADRLAVQLRASGFEAIVTAAP